MEAELYINIIRIPTQLSRFPKGIFGLFTSVYVYDNTQILKL